MDVNNSTTLGKVKVVMLKGERGETGHGALVAASAAAMVDKTQIYVYAGDENGYTFGDWYYWDGTAWADGGAYNAVVVDTDDTLTVADQAADAKAVGDILFGGADHTAKTPWIENFYAPTIAEGETFDIRNMPRYSFIYQLGSNLTGLPSGSDERHVLVIRRPISHAGNVSLFYVHEQYTYNTYIGHYTESGTEDLNTISWKWMPTDVLKTMYNYAGILPVPTNIDAITAMGVYWSETVYPTGEEPYKKITGFPFGSGWLFVTPVSEASNICLQMAIPRESAGKVPLIRRRALSGTWSAFEPIGGFTGAEVDDIKSDYRWEDWLITDFEQENNWYSLTGGFLSIGQRSQPIPVYPGQKLYGMWFGGEPPQSCGGAFLDANKNWIATVAFPYTSPGGVVYPAINVTEYGYAQANVTPGDTFNNSYDKMWEITVPANAAYIVLNLRNTNTGYKDCQSISTLPIIGATNTGNKIWRRDDPQRAVKRGKKLYIIGQSGVSIDRAKRSIYDAASETTIGTQPIVGFQEYVLPYYDAGNVVSLGFQGVGYRVRPNTSWDDADRIGKSIYQMIKDAQDILDGASDTGKHPYVGYATNTLRDADEVMLNLGLNNTGIDDLGDYDSTDNATMFGAINNLIDLIVSKNADHPVVFYIETFPDKTASVTSSSAAVAAMNEKVKQLAAARGLIVIDRAALMGLNAQNHALFSYDADRFPPYGTHLNNAGNKIRGQVVLNGLLG